MPLPTLQAQVAGWMFSALPWLEQQELGARVLAVQVRKAPALFAAPVSEQAIGGSGLWEAAELKGL